MGMLDDRVGVILNGGGEAGHDLALLMAREGARLVLNDAAGPTAERGTARCGTEGTVCAVRQGGGEALACSEPLDRLEGAQRLMQSAVERFGRIDMVVNNLGLASNREPRVLEEISQEAWQGVLRSRLKATFCSTRAALAHMRPQRRGSLLHLLPAAGLIGDAGQAHEGAVWMAIAGFSRNVAIETEHVPVTSNCIAVNHGLGAMEETAALVVFLGSGAAADVSGQLFGVRGKEIYLYAQPRIARSIHHSRGWTVEELARTIEPAMEPSFTRLRPVASYFSWEEML